MSCCLGYVTCLRLFLVALCVISAIYGVVAFAKLTTSPSETTAGFVTVEITFWMYSELILSILTSSFGAYVLKNKNRRGTIVFVAILLLSLLVYTLRYNYEIEGLEVKASETETELKNQMSDYQWYQESDRNSITQAWDKAQNGICCGVEGPRDWDKFRLSNLSETTLPPSCCPNSVIRGDKLHGDSLCTFRPMPGCRLLKDLAIMGARFAVVIAIFSETLFVAIAAVVLFMDEDLKDPAPVELPYYNNAPKQNTAPVDYPPYYPSKL